MPITDTPLRYPGGKTQLSPFVTDLLRENDLLQCVYCEPFAGGAGIACRLLLNGTVSEVWINDIDPSIHAFWHSVLNRTDDLCERIERAEVTMDEWYRQKRVQTDGRSSSLSLGFSTLFLNRTNRSGILRGGVIGGKEQNGNYLIDCRFDREDLIRKIRRIALYREQITLTRIDALEYVRNELKKLPPHSLVNIDPPYYRAGPDLYTNWYTHENHMALAVEVRGLESHWMLTYDDVDEIRAMYPDLRHYRKSLTYSAQVKRTAAELLVLSDSLMTPTSLLMADQQAA